MKYEILSIRTIPGEDSGGLSFVEGERDLPFDVKRIYWIYGIEHGVHRGFHAHTLNWQLLFCPYGVIDIILDDGHTKETVRLDDPSKGLILHPGLWREMVWVKSNSVLCVAASEYYDESEYIRNYEDFLKFVNENKSEE